METGPPWCSFLKFCTVYSMVLLLHKYKLALASALGIRFLSFLSVFWGTSFHSSCSQVLLLFMCVCCVCTLVHLERGLLPSEDLHFFGTVCAFVLQS